MTLPPSGARWRRGSIRFHLAVLLPLLMAPVLALSAFQAVLTYRHDAAASRVLLEATSAAAGPAVSSARPKLWYGRTGVRRDGPYPAPPMLGDTSRVALSGHYPDFPTWASLNPIEAFGLPFLTFALALAGGWLAAERGGGRWFAWLEGMGAGTAARLDGTAPREVHEIAERLQAMAETIGERDRDLRNNLVQRDGLLREIHHRVKNNLQVISSLLNLQQRALTDPAARAAMSDTRQRITALALIYRALYEGPDLRKVNLREFLEDLIGQLIMNDSVRRPTIRTELSIDALDIDPDHLAPLALFAVEAITNAKKHGLTEVGGRLTVSFFVRGAEAELAISDSGRPGATPAVVGEGVGRTLMLAFARQLGGKVTFCPAPGGGMTARLSFPTPAATASAA